MRIGKINVVIIEPSEMIVRGLSQILQEDEKFFLVGSYSDVTKFQEKSRSKQPVDMVIVNPTLVSYAKRGAIRALLSDVPIVALLYSYIDRDTLSQFDDTIEISDKPARILHTLEQVAIKQQYNGRPTPEAGDLSDRERDILIAVAKGMMNKEIADQYNISIHTVIAHRKNISRKTGIKSVSGFVVYALLNNFMAEHEVL